MAQLDEHTDNRKRGDNLIPQSQWNADIEIDGDSVRESFLDVQKEIAPCKPRIIGVTKYYGRDSIIKGFEAGLRDFGESRAVEAVKKIESLPEYIKQNSTFHFIGHLQTNKVDKVVGCFEYIHSLDSLKLAQTISRVAKERNTEVKALLQVNNAAEAQKFGFSKEELRKELPEILILPNIKIVGLMNMAPLGAEDFLLRKLFRDIADFKRELEKDFQINLPELSMGMSDDYKIAVQEGATMIRLGRKLFTK